MCECRTSYPPPAIRTGLAQSYHSLLLLCWAGALMRGQMQLCPPERIILTSVNAVMHKLLMSLMVLIKILELDLMLLTTATKAQQKIITKNMLIQLVLVY